MEYDSSITLFWNSKIGRFVDVLTGKPNDRLSWSGNVREWCETLVEVIVRAMFSAKIEFPTRKAYALKVNPFGQKYLESSTSYKPISIRDGAFTDGCKRCGQEEVGKLKTSHGDLVVVASESVNPCLIEIWTYDMDLQLGRVIILDKER